MLPCPTVKLVASGAMSHLTGCAVCFKHAGWAHGVWETSWMTPSCMQISTLVLVSQYCAWLLLLLLNACSVSGNYKVLQSTASAVVAELRFFLFCTQDDTACTVGTDSIGVSRSGYSRVCGVWWQTCPDMHIIWSFGTPCFPSLCFNGQRFQSSHPKRILPVCRTSAVHIFSFQPEV